MYVLVRHAMTTRIVRYVIAVSILISICAPSASAQYLVRAVNGVVNANRHIYLSGSFTGDVDSIGLSIGDVLTVPTSGDGTLLKIDGDIAAAASGTNGILAGMQIAPVFTSGGADVSGVYGAFVRSLVAPSGAAYAYGIGIDAPTGAGRNYSLLVSGDVDLKGVTQLIFEQSLNGGDVFLAGVPSNGAYTPGSLTGDLVFRGANHNFRWTTDGGNNTDLSLSAGVLTADTAVAGRPHTVATLPSGVEGMRVPVTDALSDDWGDIIIGGGAHHVLAYFNGTAWTVMAK